MSASKTILVLSPHTDDGELGCGATMHRYIEEGHTIISVSFSFCKESLPEGLEPDTLIKENENALLALGLKKENILLYDFPVRNFTENRQAILDELIQLKIKYKPDIVFTPATTDIHQDHGVITSEAKRAFKHCTIYGYEQPWNTYQFFGNTFQKISSENLSAKINALTKYKSQQSRAYMQEGFIRSLAKVRGLQAGGEWAECFETIRFITS
ncbi:MAG: PIG-L family deacetylase [Chitinophagaceae bacterium]|nr:PIG-L family deacetylase [Chitinophagaceae bacterium]